jgi:hypothetical protein
MLDCDKKDQNVCVCVFSQVNIFSTICFVRFRMNYTHDTFRIPTLAKVGKCMLKLCLAMAIRKSSQADCLCIEYPR